MGVALAGVARDAVLVLLHPGSQRRIRFGDHLLYDDAAGLFSRRDAVDRVVGAPSRHAIPIGSGDPEVDAAVATEVVMIGDASRATHDALWDYTTLQWRHADFVGEIRAAGGLDFADVEDFALALDALLGE